MTLGKTALLAFLFFWPAPYADATEITDLAAQLEAQASHTAYIFNTLLFLIGGFLVMWMAAGFAMLEAGLVRSKNVSMQCLKNITLYAVACIMFWLIGYQLMYGVTEGGFIGKFAIMNFTDAKADLGSGYSSSADWFYQMVFCATTASIVSGTLAERIKFWPFMVFICFLTGLLYPIVGAWEWGGGWLNSKAFIAKTGSEFFDFAGSTIVHSVGGWAALSGAIILGPRQGRFIGGKSHPMPGSSMPLATLGVFILWLGWFGFNGASQLAMGTISDISDIAKIFVNTNMAACAGVVMALVYTQIRYKNLDVTMVINGALAGLVAITADPLHPSVPVAMSVGGAASLLAMLIVPVLDKFKIDDVVGAIPVHLGAGILGTLAVGLTNPNITLLAQLTGVLAIGVFVLVSSSILWIAIKAIIGLRVSEEQEYAGLDHAEVGVSAYPEFVAQ